MRTARLLLLLAAGVLWVLFAPEDVVLRYVSLIVVMSVVYTFARITFGDVAVVPARVDSRRERE